MSDIIQSLIYDRTAEDVENGTDKGFYRNTDLNRVQAAVIAIRQRFLDAGYTGIPAPSFSNWTEHDIVTRNRMDEYLRAVRSLDLLALFYNAPAIPASPDRLDWRGANAIEKFLVLTDDALDRVEGAWFYCDDVFSGEVDV